MVVKFVKSCLKSYELMKVLNTSNTIIILEALSMKEGAVGQFDRFLILDSGELAINDGKCSFHELCKSILA